MAAPAAAAGAVDDAAVDEAGEDEAGEHQQRGDDERRCRSRRCRTCSRRGGRGLDAFGERGGGAGLLVVEDQATKKPRSAVGTEMLARIELEPWLPACDCGFGTARSEKTGSRKCSISLWPPSAAGTPTQPPMTERMARTTSGKSMIQGDSWTPWACGVVAFIVVGDEDRRGVPVCAWTAAPWSCRSACSSKRGAEEGLEPEAEHVEGGHAGGDEADEPEQLAEGVRRDEGLVEDLVLGEEAGEGMDAGDGEDARRHGPEGDGDALAQAAHLAHVLLAGERVDDGAGGEEEQRLEEGVGDEVEDAGGVGSDAAGQEHVAELGDGGVGEDALDVVLHHADAWRRRGRWRRR